MKIYWGSWGGSWGMSWVGTWGASWGDDEVEEHPERYGGGGRGRRLVDDAQLHRDHWEYMDRLREARARAAPDQDPKEPGQGAAGIPVQAASQAIAPVPGRAMRGKVEALKPPGLAEILGNPLMLAALAVAIEEADE